MASQAPSSIQMLKKKPVRTISGVAPITAMTKPFPCPHGKCIYCPGYPLTETPSAYVGAEPACRRAIVCNYDPYEQVKMRIEQLEAIGHCVDKIELIVFGGTFTALPLDYQEWFLQRCIDAVTEKHSNNIEEALRNAEESKRRIANICIETRPDWAKEREIDRLLRMGVTRIELGVQTIYEDVYKAIERGHSVEDVVEATRIIKDSGMMLVYHMMLNLPNSDPERDFEAFRTIFTDPRFKPDMIKIYPCLLIEGTKLYEQWLKGEYEIYSLEEVIDLIARIKGIVPRWVRIIRIQRDIPSNFIVAGIKKGNLRQLVRQRMGELGLRCKCIRCREVGHVKMERNVEPSAEHIELRAEKYEASEGEEIFLSYEDVKNDVLIALLRLRRPSEKVHREELKDCLIVRQLQVFGPAIEIGRRPSVGEWQHRGYGRALLREAERIAREEYDAKKIAVLSGIGVRKYYARFGYEVDGPYMVKYLI